MPFITQAMNARSASICRSASSDQAKRSRVALWLLGSVLLSLARCSAMPSRAAAMHPSTSKVVRLSAHWRIPTTRKRALWENSQGNQIFFWRARTGRTERVLLLLEAIGWSACSPAQEALGSNRSGSITMITAISISQWSS
jgi:hypothetical protein